MSMEQQQADTAGRRPVITLLSGGVGASGEQLVYTVLAQFPGSDVELRTTGNVRHPGQITEALQRARAEGGMVVFTLVEGGLREQLLCEAGALGVPVMDLMGPLIEWLSAALGRMPLQEPGLYRQQHREHFGRINAIEYTLKHDDGINRADWPQAEIVLVGVSRAGKTPMSIYLAVLGYKVANVPLVPEIPVPEELFALDASRVFGLTIAPEQLLVYRRHRQQGLGINSAAPPDYTDLEAITAELQQARLIYQRGNFRKVNMTDKTIEQGADEILRKLAGQQYSTGGMDF